MQIPNPDFPLIAHRVHELAREHGPIAAFHIWGVLPADVVPAYLETTVHPDIRANLLVDHSVEGFALVGFGQVAELEDLWGIAVGPEVSAVAVTHEAFSHPVSQAEQLGEIVRTLLVSAGGDTVEVASTVAGEPMGDVRFTGSP